ncbi:MMPL family transporter [Kribbella sindirgiensis]|uniref:MMPL family transporter n=1 Tax=Kribbella sindirgiensis TaxID=1124744 RepID=A0A4R0I0S5_9ACTN|nr:MMPL family transporter [Kribbella sindirgiensis]TCC16761.1 MMPL family transporter [Kribbella sindirgiensis]
MATILARLGRWAFRRRGVTVLVWLALLGAAVLAGLTAPAAPADDFSMPGTESQATMELLQKRFPGLIGDGGEGRVVFVAPAGEEVTSPRFKAEIQSAAYVTLTFDVPAASVTADSRDQVAAVVDAARGSGLTVEAGGEALESGGPAGIAELIAISLAAVILLVTLGSMVAAGLPLLTAIVGVAISLLSLLAVSKTFGLSQTSTTLALMLGLAVGIDYALFVVARYREERGRGAAPIDAVSLAVGTAGSAVAFAGITVVIALAGLAVIGMPMLTKMGLAAAAAVVIAVLVALTLVPALIGFAPDKVLSRSARRGAAPATTAGYADRWARFVLRRPIAVLLLGTVLLGTLAIPALGLRLGMPGDESKPTTATQRRAYDELAKAFGPGFNGPLMIVVDAQGAPDLRAAVAAIAGKIASTKGVVSVSPPMPSENGDTALFQAIPATSPTDAATTGLVKTLRETRPAIVQGTGATFKVTGTTAINIDLAGKLQRSLVPYLATVVGLAVLLLLVVFRSVLVPLKAALGFLLSVLAALGAVVLVFQHGFLGGLFGVEQTGPVMSAVPIFMIGVVFGLAMDYEVFLVSRTREAFVHGHAPRAAIETGMRQSARVVVAAALIMMGVFAGFVTEQDAFIKMLGFALAAAVFLDAFVVRLAIVPAVMALLGRHAWWLPRRLDRILPGVDVEGARLARHPERERTPVAAP